MPRITIELSAKINKMLKELADKQHTSKVDVLRRALVLYNYAHREVKDKERKLVVADEDAKVLRELVLDI